MSAPTLKTRRVALNELQADDVLAEPIADANGGVLVAAGTNVSAVMAERLRDRGVTDAVIVETTQPRSQAERETALDIARQQIRARIDYLFRYGLRRNQIHPLMHLIWRYRSEPLS